MRRIERRAPLSSAPQARRTSLRQAEAGAIFSGARHVAQFRRPSEIGKARRFFLCRARVVDAARLIERHATKVIAGIAALAWLLRAWPFFRETPLAYPIDYDEGVYFAASAVMLRGEVAYRDFVFVHPPGLLLALLPASLVAQLSGPAAGFIAARWLATFAGAATTALCGAIARRHFGPVAGIAAALFYASYPEATGVDRGPFLEPFLNLACLAFAWCWLSPAPHDRLAGALAGWAVAIKIVAGSYCLAAVASRVLSSPGRLVRWAAVSVVAFACFVGPFVALAPTEFVTDVLWFQLTRPPDGYTEISDRLWQILDKRHPITPWLAFVGACVAFFRFRRPSPASEPERFFAVAFVLTVAGFLASKSYWSQYNAYLAPSEAVLAAFGGTWLVARFSSLLRLRHAQVALSAALLLACVPGARQSIRMARWRSPELAEFGAALRERLPSSTSLFSFEPAWLLVADRLPSRIGGALIADSYGFMVLAGMRGGGSFEHAAGAILSPAAQQAVSPAIDAAGGVVLGQRGHAQLGEPLRARVLALTRMPLPVESPDVYLR